MKLSLLIIIQICFIVAQASGDEARTDPTWPVWYKMYVLCRDTKIKFLRLDKVSLEDATRFINDTFTQSTGTSLGFTFVGPLSEPTAQKAPAITLLLTNISVSDALDKVTNQMHAEVTFTDLSIIVGPIVPKKSRKFLFDIRDPARLENLHLPDEIVLQGPARQLAVSKEKCQLTYWGTVDDAHTVEFILRNLQIQTDK